MSNGNNVSVTQPGGGSTLYRIGADPWLAANYPTAGPPMPGQAVGGPNLSGSDPGQVYLKMQNALGLNGIQSLYTHLTGQTADEAHIETAMKDLISQAGGSQNGVYGGLMTAGLLGNYDVKTGGNAANSVSLNAQNEAYLASMTAQQEVSAYSSVTQALDYWGLMDLAPTAWQMISDPGQHYNADMVLQQIRNSPQYQARFPGINNILVGGGRVMTENEYITHEQDVKAQMANWSVPSGFVTQQEIGNLIQNGIYGNNLTARLQNGYDVMKNAPKEIRQALKQNYGISNGGLLAYYLDPKKGLDLLNKQNVTAEVQGYGLETGIGKIQKSTAEAIAALYPGQAPTAGVSDAASIKAAESSVSGLVPLETAQVGMRGQARINQEQILSQAFKGLDAQVGTTVPKTQEAIRLAEEARSAGLRGGGGFAEGARGVVGLGSTSTAGMGQA